MHSVINDTETNSFLLTDQVFVIGAISFTHDILVE